MFKTKVNLYFKFFDIKYQLVKKELNPHLEIRSLTSSPLDY